MLLFLWHYLSVCINLSYGGEKKHPSVMAYLEIHFFQMISRSKVWLVLFFFPLHTKFAVPAASRGKKGDAERPSGHRLRRNLDTTSWVWSQ